MNRPVFLSATVKDGRRWIASRDWVYQEKLDGVWHIEEISNAVLVGELVKGKFTAFDIVEHLAHDVRRLPLRKRLAILRSLGVPMVREGNGGEFLEAILAQGGEGIVAKHLDSYFGQPESWIKCKRNETHDLAITAIHPTKQSVQLGARGWLAILSPAEFHQAAIGRIAEVRCHSIHPSGKFREPVFVRYRKDKENERKGNNLKSNAVAWQTPQQSQDLGLPQKR